ncbi:hypothetical protein EJ04DRAFT_365453 [Polyplosphaeria fusca]|uniref:HTH psq-type domain-containing protein n=1 Tax=Polyplosphaeria fusca TaxID=682080 RepID=A0A9P4QV05_9PLEO|nr:hypothetical protein EJ04DRAFT_365453 [Polyplosphaeria fusca]
MPTKPKSLYHQEESKIEALIESIEEKSKLNLSKLARENGVSYHRLRRRLNGGASRSTHVRSGKKLSELQKEKEDILENSEGEVSFPLFVNEILTGIFLIRFHWQLQSNAIRCSCRFLNGPASQHYSSLKYSTESRHGEQ